MAGIQIIDPLRVDYTDANALVQSGLKALMDSPTAFQTQINANQTRLDNDTLGLIQEMAMKYAPGTPEFEAGRANILMNNPNAYVPEQSIVTAGQTGIETRQKNEKGVLGIASDQITNANAVLTGIGLDLGNQTDQEKLTQFKGINAERKALNDYVRLGTNMYRTPEEEALYQQLGGTFNFMDLTEVQTKLTELGQREIALNQAQYFGERGANATDAGILLNGVSNGFDAGNATYGGGRGGGGSSTSSSGGGTGGSFTYPQTGSIKNLGSLIQRGESGEASYNAVNYGKNKSGTENLSNLTYGQIVANQKSGKMLAVGKYQFHAISLKEAQAALPWLKSDTKMTPEVQDRIFAEYYLGKKRPEIADYIRGKSNNLEAAANAFASEWAAAEGTNGKGKYKGNNVSIASSEVIEQLKNTRTKYNQMVRGGISDANAIRGAALFNGTDPRGGQQTTHNPNSYLSYNNSKATRNQKLGTDLEQSLSFLGDLGVTFKVNSGGQAAKGTKGAKRVGSTAHDHGNAGDGQLIYQGRVLDWNKASDLPILKKVVEEAAANGINGIGAGYMGTGTVHFGKQSKTASWGGGGTEKSPGFGWVQEAMARGNARRISGGGGSSGFVGGLRENRYNPLALQAVQSILGDGDNNPVYQKALEYFNQGRLSGREAAQSRMMDDAAAYQANQQSKSAEQGPSISLSDLFGEENKGHLKDYFKLQNMTLEDFNNASTKEQKAFLNDYVKVLEQTSNAEYKGVDRAANPLFISATKPAKALNELKTAYAAEFGDEEFLAGKASTRSNNAQKQKVYPYNFGIMVVDKLLKSTSLGSRPSPYDKMLTPKVVDTAVKNAMSKYEQYLVNQMQKEDTQWFTKSKYSVEKFKKGYVADENKLQELVRAEINSFTKREQLLREKDVNKVNLNAARGATIRNIKAAINSRK